MKKIFILIALTVNVTLNYSQQKTTRISDYQEDIEFLKKALPQKHPNLFFYQSKEDFEKRLDAIADSGNLSNNSELQVQMQLREAIAAIGDPHTNFGFYDILEEEGYFPLEIFWFSDGIRIMGADSTYKSALGKKLIAINHMPVEDVIERISNVVQKNEPYFLHKRMHFYLMLNGILKSYGITDSGPALFTFEDIHGNKEEMEINMIKGMYNIENFARLENTSSFWQSPIKENYFLLKYYDDDGILFIQYNSCWSREAEEQYGDKEKAKNLPSFNDFKEEIFKILAEKPVNKILFDMRFNGGGSSGQGTKLVEELSKVESINHKDKLFVAISQHTFSSAVINAMNFRQMTNATLIGQPAGGRPNHYGEVRTLKLPKTGLEVYHSTKYFKFIDEEVDAVIPDVIIDMNYSDLANGYDSIYHYVKNHNPQNTKN